MNTTTSTAARFISRRAAAAYLGVSPRLLDGLVASKRLPVCRPSKRRVLLDVRDLDSFMGSCKA